MSDRRRSLRGQGPEERQATLWWAATMITTINTATDPVTWEGRIVGFLMRVAGLSLFGYLTATLATYFIGASLKPGGTFPTVTEEREQDELDEIHREIEEIRARLDGPASGEPKE